MVMNTRRKSIHNSIKTPDDIHKPPLRDADKIAQSSEIKTLVGDVGSISTIESKTNKSRRTKLQHTSSAKHHLTFQKIEKTCNMKNSVKPNFLYPSGLYKADSGEPKLKNTRNGKQKKSVLTLPTNSAPLPNGCTVSDMTDYYVSKTEQDHIKSNHSLHSKEMYNCKVTGKSKFVNTSIIEDKTKHVKAKKGRKSYLTKNKTGKGDLNEIWSVLKSVNHMQFRQSSIVSIDSEIHTKRTKTVNNPLYKHKICNKRLIETCCTKEKIELSEKSKTLTPESSLSTLSRNGKITIINEEDQFHKLCKKVNTRLQNQGKHSHKSTEANNPKACNKFQSPKTLMVQNYQNGHNKRDKPYNMINGKFSQNNSKQFERGDASSGSSKARRFYEYGHKKYVKSSMPHNREINSEDNIKSDAHNRNGIIKVVFNNERIVKESSLDSSLEERDSPPIPRLRYKSKCPTPKRTGINELRRQLARIRFPVVVTKCYELSSTIEVSNQSPPQFDGLEKQIWPFMNDWFNKNHLTSKCKTYFREHRLNSKSTKLQSQSIPRSNVDAAKKRLILRADHTKVIKGDNLTQNKNVTNKITQPNKNTNLKETAVNLFNKNLIGENTGIKPNKCTKNQAKQMSAQGDQPYCMKELKYAKGNLASDFIENVIKKVCSGVYYNKDISKEPIESVQINRDEIKSELMKPRKALLPVATISPSNIFATILAYDEILNSMEVNTKNTKELELINSIANIVVRFDIALHSFNECAQVTGSSNCISITDPDSNLKVFKSNTALFNHMLPASVCTLMPMYMRNILLNTKSMCKPKALWDRNHTSSEVTVTEIPPSVNLPSSQSLQPKLTVNETIPLVPLARKIFKKGHFGHTTAIGKIKDKKTSGKALHPDSCQEVSKLLSKVMRPWSTQDNSYIRVMLAYSNNKNTLNQHSANNIDTVPISAIHSHIARNRTLISSSGFDVNSIMFKMMHYFNSQINYCFNWPTNISQLNIWYGEYLENTQISIRFEMKNHQDYQEIITINLDEVDFSKVNVKSFGNNMKSLDYHKTAKTTKLIEESSTNSEMNVKNNSSKASLKNSTIRNKRFLRLYRKCNSMSDIQDKKSVSLPLNKITIKDFFEILGLKQTLVDVMDGVVEKKILECLSEMKSWVSEISPRQALLVFLLSNKKDTPSLVKLRPVVLQAIAVNRITRSSELDIEIEVIEKEQICPIVIQASDYKRPFNEDSEKLLKSLLSKRKKLNPSYLRVMARYVGLGLLKSPGKNL
ncbi:hypothetical protein JYU34_015740 [Plutella xylostella]|uniref:Uncharacterized protein n=1 Tax=Plutella xylostella TaxID=51655 RepID=A0ABQ7Q4N3_PLUXY|nr:hypothetical protein JYU34_015740 [Plutella xylostella]